MEAIETLKTTLTTLTTCIVTYEDDRKKTNEKLRSLYEKVNELERGLSSIIERKSESQISTEEQCPKDAQELLRNIEDKLDTKQDLESILNFTRMTLRQMINDEVGKRKMERIRNKIQTRLNDYNDEVGQREMERVGSQNKHASEITEPITHSCNNETAMREMERIRCEIQLASRITPTEPMYPTYSCNKGYFTQNQAASSQDSSNDAMLSSMFMDIIRRYDISEDFVEELLEHKGVYITGSVVLKTLVNQEFDDFRDWLDVIVAQNNRKKIKKLIKAHGYKRVASKTVDQTTPGDWIRKIYRKKNSKTLKVDMVVYFNCSAFGNHPSVWDYITHSKFMLPFKFQHNFYDGINFYVLDKEALRTKTHVSIREHSGEHVRTLEAAGFNFKVVATIPNSQSLEVSKYKTFAQFAKELDNSSEESCDFPVLSVDYLRSASQSSEETPNASQIKLSDWFLKDTGLAIHLCAIRFSDKDTCIVPIVNSGTFEENFKLVVERLGFDYRVFEDLFNTEKVLAVGSAVTQALLQEFWLDAKTVTLDVTSLMGNLTEIVCILQSHGFVECDPIINQFGCHVRSYSYPSQKQNRISFITRAPYAKHPLKFNQNSFNGKTFLSHDHIALVDCAHIGKVREFDSVFLNQLVGKYKHRGFKIDFENEAPKSTAILIDKNNTGLPKKDVKVRILPMKSEF